MACFIHLSSHIKYYTPIMWGQYYEVRGECGRIAYQGGKTDSCSCLGKQKHLISVWTLENYNIMVRQAGSIKTSQCIVQYCRLYVAWLYLYIHYSTWTLVYIYIAMHYYNIMCTVFIFVRFQQMLMHPVLACIILLCMWQGINICTYSTCTRSCTSCTCSKSMHLFTLIIDLC